jgi:excisionase family DNA binding protein
VRHRTTEQTTPAADGRAHSSHDAEPPQQVEAGPGQAGTQAPSRLLLRLLLKPPEAARALAISERKLWQLTKDGEIRSVRIGRAVRYDLRDLQDYVDRQK